MGGGVSSPFKSTPVERELPRHVGATDGGRVAHIVGTVAVADATVLSSPFGGHCGAAIRVAASRQNTSKMGAFRAQSALEFYVTSGSTKVRVLVPDVESWAWRLKTTHTAFNIMVDEDNNMVSGGKMHEHSKVEVRPDAMTFWERLNGGRDPVTMIQHMAPQRRPRDSAVWTSLGTGMSEDLQKPRMAIEQTLQIGSPVAIVGAFGVTEGGEITISPATGKGKGTITNDPSFAASLVEAVGDDGGGSEGVRVVPMGKHKKARNYPGKQW